MRCLLRGPISITMISRGCGCEEDEEEIYMKNLKMKRGAKVMDGENVRKK